MHFSLVASLALLASFTTAWAPSCAWNGCMTGWQPGSCSSNSHWDCLCGNATAIAQVNSCVASSCSNATDQEAIYAAIDQLCADNGHTITNSPEATFSATSGGSVGPTITGRPGPGYGYGYGNGWNSGNWSSWLSACSTAIGAGWGYNSSYPHYGGVCLPTTGWSGSYGPWTAAWTWTQCTGTGTDITTIATTMTMTTTVSGVASVLTSATKVAVQAQAQAASSSVTTTASGNLAASTNGVSLAYFGGVAAAAFGLMVAL